jgi:hypothetical protein
MLGDLVSRYVPSWLPDGTAELLDDVVSEVSECIQCSDHSVIVEGFRVESATMAFLLPLRLD